MVKAGKTLEEWYLKDETNEEGVFMFGRTEPSIADFQSYCEISQVTPQFHQLFPYPVTEYPRLNRWLEAMRLLKHHDDVHIVNTGLGKFDDMDPKELMKKLGGLTKSQIMKYKEFEG